MKKDPPTKDPLAELPPPIEPRRRRRWSPRRRRILAIAGALGLLAVTLWGFREARRAGVRRAVLPELARVGVEPVTFGLTGPGLAVTVTMGHERGEGWLREHLGDGWFSRPVEFRAEELKEGQVPHAVAQLRRLGKVHAILVSERRMGEPGVEAIRRGLPEALVTVRTASGDRPIRPLHRPLWRW